MAVCGSGGSGGWVVVIDRYGNRRLVQCTSRGGSGQQ